MAALEALIASGLINHHYNPTRGIDEFRATEDLTWQWEREFSELTDIVDPTETIIVELEKMSPPDKVSSESVSSETG